MHLTDRLARHDDSRHAGGAFRQLKLHLGEPVAVGRDSPKGLRFGRARGMQIDPVEVIARLFGRDGKLCLVDEALELSGFERELMAHFARGEIGKIALGQRLQRETGAAGADRQCGAIAGRFQNDLRAFRQLPHDVKEHVRRHGG